MNEKLEEIISSSAEFKRLCEEFDNGKMAKTLLLLSKDEKYVFEFARLLSSKILNGISGDLKGSDNYVKVMADSHPDLKIYPTKDKLLVADSENIVFESSVKPIFSDRKVFIIKNIENSMEASQNKLLKTLEEPENNVYFILTSSNINAVLPTIRSRCNKVELGKLGKGELKAYLVECENRELILALSEGYIGQAEKLMNMDNLESLFRDVFALVAKLKSSKEILFYSKAVSAYFGDFDLIIKILSLIFEDLLYIKANLKDLHLIEQRDILTNISDEFTIKAIIEINKLIDNAVKEVSYNCNLTLVFENLLLNILEVKYLCR